MPPTSLTKIFPLLGSFRPLRPYSILRSLCDVIVHNQGYQLPMDRAVFTKTYNSFTFGIKRGVSLSYPYQGNILTSSMHHDDVNITFIFDKCISDVTHVPMLPGLKSASGSLVITDRVHAWMSVYSLSEKPSHFSAHLTFSSINEVGVGVSSAMDVHPDFYETYPQYVVSGYNPITLNDFITNIINLSIVAGYCQTYSDINNLVQSTVLSEVFDKTLETGETFYLTGFGGFLGFIFDGDFSPVRYPSGTLDPNDILVPFISSGKSTNYQFVTNNCGYINCQLVTPNELSTNLLFEDIPDPVPTVSIPSFSIPLWLPSTPILTIPPVPLPHFPKKDCDTNTTLTNQSTWDAWVAGCDCTDSNGNPGIIVIGDYGPICLTFDSYDPSGNPYGFPSWHWPSGVSGPCYCPKGYLPFFDPQLGWVCSRLVPTFPYYDPIDPNYPLTDWIPRVRWEIDLDPPSNVDPSPTNPNLGVKIIRNNLRCKFVFKNPKGVFQYSGYLANPIQGQDDLKYTVSFSEAVGSDDYYTYFKRITIVFFNGDTISHHADDPKIGVREVFPYQTFFVSGSPCVWDQNTITPTYAQPAYRFRFTTTPQYPTPCIGYFGLRESYLPEYILPSSSLYSVIPRDTLAILQFIYYIEYDQIYGQSNPVYPNPDPAPYSSFRNMTNSELQGNLQPQWRSQGPAPFFFHNQCSQSPDPPPTRGISLTMTFYRVLYHEPFALPLISEWIASILLGGLLQRTIILELPSTGQWLVDIDEAPVDEYGVYIVYLVNQSTLVRTEKLRIFSQSAGYLNKFFLPVLAVWTQSYLPDISQSTVPGNYDAIYN